MGEFYMRSHVQVAIGAALAVAIVAGGASVVRVAASNQPYGETVGQAPSAEPLGQPFAMRQAQLPSTAPAGVPTVGTVEGTSATVFEDQDIRGILGRSVRSMAGEDMGRIVDIIVSRDGHVVAAVIDFGGFLGVGSRKIAVDWHALHFASEDKSGLITLKMTQSQVREAPEYKEGKPVVVLGALPAETPREAPEQ